MLVFNCYSSEEFLSMWFILITEKLSCILLLNLKYWNIFLWNLMFSDCTECLALIFFLWLINFSNLMVLSSLRLCCSHLFPLFIYYFIIFTWSSPDSYLVILPESYFGIGIASISGVRSTADDCCGTECIVPEDELYNVFICSDTTWACIMFHDLWFDISLCIYLVYHLLYILLLHAFSNYECYFQV